MNRIRLYLELSKSGIVTLVVISVLGGYLAGHPFELPFDPAAWIRMGVTLLGVFLLASGSSGLNQIQDLQMDTAMGRTAKRPLPSGRLGLREAWLFVGVSLLGGMALLLWIDPAVAGLGISAVVFYNGLYTLWWKRRWAFAAIPGAVPGALPILMGYAAASGDVWAPGGIYLFALLFFWQMPHFWVLALKYKGDYATGGVPTLPVVLGAGVTVQQIVIWSLGYIGIAFLAPLFLDVGWIYVGISFLVSGALLWLLRQFSVAPESKAWLKFFLWVNFSLVFYIFAAVADLWSVLLVRHFTQ